MRDDRHRGGGHPPTPATPPCVRVRTRRFELVTLAPLDQRRKSERFEVCIGKPNGEGLSPREVPRASPAAGGVARQPWTHPQLQQRRPATAWGFPLPPQSRPQPQADPAGEVNEHFGRFAEAEIVTPAPQIRGQLFHRRLDADAFRPARDLPNSLLKPIQGLRRYDTLDLRAGAKAEPEKLSFLWS